MQSATLRRTTLAIILVSLATTCGGDIQDAQTHPTSARASAQHGLATAGASHRRQLVTYPTAAVNGSASAAFPTDAFGAWCSADPGCTAAAPGLTLSLAHYTDASSFTSATLNWPDVFSGSGISGLQLVSGVLDLQLSGYPAKQDREICDDLTPCAARLKVPLTGAANASLSSVCLRLEPRVTGTGYQAYGFPDGSYGTSIDGSIVNGVLHCNTTKFGKHVIMQYVQAKAASAAISPSQTPSSSSAPPPSPQQQASSSPPPPSSLYVTGATYKYDVKLRMTLDLSIGFDTLKADAELLSALTTSLETSLASTLRTLVQQQLLLPSAPFGSILKISRLDLDTQKAVSVVFSLTVPAGATEGQVAGLMKVVVGDTKALFSGSSYVSYLNGPASVAFAPAGDSKGLSGGAVAGIAIAAGIATLLLLGACYGIYRWRVFAPIVPKKPAGDWDPTGVAALPNKSGLRQRVARTQVAAEADELGPLGMPPQGVPSAPGPYVGPAGAAPPWDGAGGKGGGAGWRGEAAGPPSKPAWM